MIITKWHISGSQNLPPQCPLDALAGMCSESVNNASMSGTRRMRVSSACNAMRKSKLAAAWQTQDDFQSVHFFGMEHNLAVRYFGRHIRKLDASNFCASTLSVRSPNWTSIPAKLFTEVRPCRSCCLCCRLGWATKHYGRSVTTAARRHCWNACWQRLQSGHVAFVRN